MVHLDYRDTRPIYIQIVDGYREQISAGVLQPGEKMPTVRELAAALAINPNTIQRAYRQLEMEGWIVTMQGKGCFVSSGTSFRQKEIDRLLTVFDETAAKLMKLGVIREKLTQRLEKEETKDV